MQTIYSDRFMQSIKLDKILEKKNYDTVWLRHFLRLEYNISNPLPDL